MGYNHWEYSQCLRYCLHYEVAINNIERKLTVFDETINKEDITVRRQNAQQELSILQCAILSITTTTINYQKILTTIKNMPVRLLSLLYTNNSCLFVIAPMHQTINTFIKGKS